MDHHDRQIIRDQPQLGRRDVRMEHAKSNENPKNCESNKERPLINSVINCKNKIETINADHQPTTMHDINIKISQTTTM